jgi:hypothetical protein
MCQIISSGRRERDSQPLNPRYLFGRMGHECPTGLSGAPLSLRPLRGCCAPLLSRARTCATFRAAFARLSLRAATATSVRFGCDPASPRGSRNPLARGISAHTAASIAGLSTRIGSAGFRRKNMRGADLRGAYPRAPEHEPALKREKPNRTRARKVNHIDKKRTAWFTFREH